MINPNKLYKAKELATIEKIELQPFPEVHIKTDSGQTFSGWLTRVHTHWKSLKAGDRVEFSVQYSIMAEQYKVATLIKKRRKVA